MKNLKKVKEKFTIFESFNKLPIIDIMKPHKLLLGISALLCLLGCFLTVNAQTDGGTAGSRVPVSGIVVDQASQPIVGAFVLQKGTSNGTMTDVDGQVTLHMQQTHPMEIVLLQILSIRL